MAGQQQRKSGGVRKYGRNKEKCKKYAGARRRFYNKLKRIRQSSGIKAAEQYQRGPIHSKRYTKRHGSS